jgi:hypothetical protein
MLGSITCAELLINGAYSFISIHDISVGVAEAFAALRLQRYRKKLTYTNISVQIVQRRYFFV